MNVNSKGPAILVKKTFQKWDNECICVDKHPVMEWLPI